MLPQRGRGLGVQRDAALLVGLEVALDRAAAVLRIARRSHIVSRPSASETADQRSAHSSPRRAPVVIATHTSVPQSGSRHAAFTIRAACSGVGGAGSAGRRGGSACASGLTETQRHRTARL